MFDRLDERLPQQILVEGRLGPLEAVAVAVAVVAVVRFTRSGVTRSPARSVALMVVARTVAALMVATVRTARTVAALARTARTASKYFSSCILNPIDNMFQRNILSISIRHLHFDKNSRDEAIFLSSFDFGCNSGMEF